MNKLPLFIASAVIALAASACSTTPATSEAAAAAPAAPSVVANHEVDGYWRHDKLTTSKGDDLPISGVFLLHDGVFIEQATMDTPTAMNSQAMAHAGPYVVTDQGVNLTAEQQISIATEGDEAPLSFAHDIKHVLRAENTGDHLVLTFGSGTEQTFTRIPTTEIKQYKFANGRLALTGDRFVLVAGDQSGVVSGYGRYRMSGDAITFNAERWAEATPAKANIAVDKSVKASLSNSQLRLEDGRTFSIVD